MRILLIPGLWLDGFAWDQVVPALRALGHQPVAMTLPGQGDGAASATLDDQVGAVVAAVDAAAEESGGRVLVVGHSAACTLAWLAADARPAAVAAVVMIGGFPAADGDRYADFFETVDGVVPFPGWGPFEGADSADLDDAARAAFTAGAVAVPEAVTKGVVHLRDERRYSLPVVVVCPEFSPAQAQQAIDSGEVPEIAKAEHVQLVDIDSGHWPMLTRPSELAQLLGAAAGQ